MAQATNIRIAEATGAHSSVAPTRELVLDLPEVGQIQSVAVKPDQGFAIAFDLTAARVSLQADALILAFEDGRAIQLEGFVSAAQSGAPPYFVLQNGTTILGNDIVGRIDEMPGQDSIQSMADLLEIPGGGTSAVFDDFGRLITLLRSSEQPEYTSLQPSSPPLTNNATTIDLSTGTIATVETLTGSGSNDTVTLSDAQWAGLTTINLGAGAADILNVLASSDISASVIPTVSNAETGSLVGTTGNDVTTMTGAQLDAIIIGTGTINFGTGAADTLNLTSVSADLNTLAGTDASIQGLEAISFVSVGAGVTFDLSAQTEGFSLTGTSFADTLTTGSGDDTITNSGTTISATITAILAANPEAVLGTDGVITYFFTTAGTVTYTLPSGITSIDITAWGGGAGGGGGGDNNAGGTGGGAGYVDGTIAVSSGDTVAIAIGGGGGAGLYAAAGGNSEGTGGGGGGYSGVFDTSIAHANALFIAGGGGAGGGGDNTGGAPDGGAGGASGGTTGSAGAGGGGTVGAGQGGTSGAGGAAGTGNNAQTVSGGAGGTLTGGDGGDTINTDPTAGGAAGINGGGAGGLVSTSLGRAGGGAGGGGYYGGGGGTASNAGNTSGAGGGGGSSYIDGSATGTTNTGATGATPLQSDSHYLSGVGVGGTSGPADTDGSAGGDGLVILSYDMGAVVFTTLAGGAGNDDLYGAAGMDIFVFSDTGAANQDTIYNFNAQIDKLDLSDLLTGYDPVTELITDFVQITDSGADSEVRVDTTGSASFGAATVVATIDSITGLTDEAFLEVAGVL